MLALSAAPFKGFTMIFRHLMVHAQCVSKLREVGIVAGPAVDVACAVQEIAGLGRAVIALKVAGSVYGLTILRRNARRERIRFCAFQRGTAAS